MGGISMNENIDLTKILKGCPKGTEFYHVIYGKVYFNSITPCVDFPIVFNYDIGRTICLTKEGKALMYAGECGIFPSKEQRDWLKFERFWDKLRVDKFDPKAFEPFQKVLVRDYTDAPWTIDFFSYRFDKIKNIRGLKYCWVYCIPYNVDTKHLVGKVQDCPEYYKWWEE